VAIESTASDCECPDQEEPWVAFRRSLEATLGIPFSEGNRITPLRNGVEIFPAMLQAIDAATSTVRFLTFINWTGEIAQRFADALARKAQQGVDVRVLLDAYGAMQMDESLIQKMKRAGVHVLRFRPAPCKAWRLDNRTHRKVLICDGRIAFSGGVGITREWEGDARNHANFNRRSLRKDDEFVLVVIDDELFENTRRRFRCGPRRL
jgi:cardiolipin synthase